MNDTPPTSRINEMINVISKVSQGNFSQIKITAKSDELDILASNINKMVDSFANQIKELIYANQQLIETKKLIDISRVIAGLAHEINQPLQGLVLILNSIMKDIKTNNININNLHEDLKDAKDRVFVISEIIEHVKIYTFQENEIQLVDVDVNYVLKNVIKLIHADMAKRTIEVITNITDDLPHIKAIAQELLNCLLYIIANSKDAFDSLKNDINIDKKIWLKTYTHINEFDGQKNIIISVTDNAGGIPINIIDRIFDPFFSTKPSGKGKGLGLAISFETINKFGGTIKAKVEDSKTTISIILPHPKT